MNRDETAALFLEGREAWNAWAKQMLAERKALEAAGTWKSRRTYIWHREKGENSEWREKGENSETQAWLNNAFADFSRCRFLVSRLEEAEEAPEAKGSSGTPEVPVKLIKLGADQIDFGGVLFPDYADFRSAAFSGDAYFGSATFFGNAYFKSAAFSGTAYFESAVFSGTANFESSFAGDAAFKRAAFSGDAYFGSATFFGNADFESAVFSSGASFRSAAFSGTADFERATFSGPASFGSAAFSGDANFVSAAFFGHTDFVGAMYAGDASFVSASFQASTYYSRVNFQKIAKFKGIEVKRSLFMTGAEFTEVPAFNQADFKQAPDLDDVSFPLPRFWRRGKKELVAQYRAIRRMAIQGANYEREQMAYKGELRSRRWTQDKFWHAGLWLGLLYDGIADCGRSIVRPANVWAGSIVAFAAFYWWRAAAGIGHRCAEADGPFVQALFLSVKNALVIFGGTRDARVNQAYLCLYGGTAEQPTIPATVTFVETLAQIPVSATLIFLFVLAVKNRFKIK